MAQKNELTICVDSFVTVENLGDLPRVLNEIKIIKENPCDFLRVHGVKFFVDGSLGSKTAYLSENYLQSSQKGMISWTNEEIKEALRIIWSNGLEAAVHTIGDQAAHEAISAARQVSASGVLGRLHIEHAQILRPDTIQMMKPLHVTCHMQPCHWLSDHTWLSDVLPEKLLKNIFPWEALRKNKIPFDFGSDSPIEPTLLHRNLVALKQSEKQVPTLQDDWKKYHAHPDMNWTQSWTEFDEHEVKQVYFNQKPLLIES